MTKFKKHQKIFAIFLILAMTLTILPAEMFSVFARETAFKEAYVLSEEIEMRKSDEKHFVMSDGTMMAVKYNEQVHYQEESGKWIEIDNTLVYDTVEKKYINKNNPTFDIGLNENGKVNISSDKGYTLSFKTNIIQGLKTVQFSAPSKNIVLKESSVSKNTVKYESDKKSFETLKVHSGVEYNDAYGSNTKLCYSISQNTVKEDLIIEKNIGITSFETEYYTGLHAVKQDDGSLLFVDKKANIIFIVSHPYMYDSEYSECPNIEVNLHQTDNGWRVVYVPDKDWLTSDDRVYPLTFDPIVANYEYSNDSNIELQGYSRSLNTVTSIGSLKVGYEYMGAYFYYRTAYKPLSYPEIDLAFHDIVDIKLNLKTEYVAEEGNIRVYKMSSNNDAFEASIPQSEPLYSGSFNTSTAEVELPILVDDYIKYYNNGYTAPAPTTGYIVTDVETESGMEPIISGNNRRIVFHDITSTDKRPVLYVKYVAKGIDGRYTFIEQNNMVMCINNDATSISLVAKTGNDVNNPAGLTNPVNSMWKFTYANGVYRISPVNALTKYLTASSSGALTLSTDESDANKWNVFINPNNGKMTLYNVQYSLPLVIVDGNALISSHAVNSSWTVTDAFSLKGAISDKREYILYNPAIGKSLEFTNGETNTVGFGEFNARTEILEGTKSTVNGETYYKKCTVVNKSTIQRVQLINKASNDYVIIPFINGAYSNKYLSLVNGQLVVSSTQTIWKITRNPNGTFRIANGSYILGSDMSNTNPVASNTASNTQWNIDCVGLLVPKIAQKTGYTCGAASATMILKYLGWSEDYNQDGMFDENDFIQYIGQYVEQTYGVYATWYICVDYINELIGDRYVATSQSSPNYMPVNTLTVKEYCTTISKSLNRGQPLYIRTQNSGEGNGRADSNYMMENNGHIVVIKGIYYDHSNKQYHISISDPNYRYTNADHNGDGHEGGVGFDNVVDVNTMLNYSKEGIEDRMRMIVSIESIYGYWE